MQSDTQAGTRSSGSEKIFFDEGNVLVTRTRFVVEGTIYPVSGIASVNRATTPPDISGEAKAIVIGLLMMLIGFLGAAPSRIFGSGWMVFMVLLGVAGICLCGFAVMQLKNAKSSHSVVITTVAGEVKAVSSYDAADIARITRAVESAIIARG
jgi:uncharacterized membrane protein